MLVAGGRRVLYYAFVVLMLVVLHTCHTCQVEGIRVLPGNAVPNVEFSHGSVNDDNKRKDLFSKYFNGRTRLGPRNTTQKGFDEAKRRVPSCPDPLHN
ncbi:hypothetical protein LR48_Vigan02g247600 [Vigna angularis]|uniref:CLAVATA3/ESR-like protein n=2 Tax=Phaseolus angularis TaxID=3914 RepID=A0A0L9U0N0_PHAAN|nr:uncharacterized protein HKW66_Vig0197690 [Vigna angularis]KOM36326.1 hypothetical protein LR48_Vigan02g247600 [Vigna angularis]BAT93763.1 hypothetical protein VIGAN_08029200 [Vigna angularis var. angularis]